MRRSSVGFFALAAAALFAATAAPHLEGAAQAQPLQCVAPTNLARPQVELPPPGEARRTPIAGYILALSWSPEFCRKRNIAGTLQCNGKAGDFGFILHGLWPEAKGPNYPQWCRTVGQLSRQEVARNFCMTPDVQLLQHEWAKHGSCMTRKPETYFGAARILYGALRYPDMARLSLEGERGGRLNAARLADEFALANPGLPANAVSIKTNRKGWLEEVRLCLGKKFRPERCPAFVKGAPAKARIKVWRGR